MDAILNYRPEGGEDYYALLGCDELSSVEQILAEFKVRALECHPDKHPENSKAGYFITASKMKFLHGTVRDGDGEKWENRVHIRKSVSLNVQQRRVNNGFAYNKVRGKHLHSELKYSLDFSSDYFCTWNQWRQESDDETFNFDLFIWSMHWAVRSKKDLMLEGTDQTCTSTVQNKERNEQRETNRGEPDSTTERRQKESGSPEKASSPQNPGSPGLSDLNYGHLRFRWSGDAPSELLRKFRNYEI
ncbi:dnaJ homolog subfamily C member 12 [Onychomys torridus]|uniref:dnaJ homolog subfamily C member 12 n=1 Tax=Onychomys torridus TaxID=38674 RepID=UPI00167F609B|nr:dnaJ homolog subfamily C member 12 [Onychomys torridus]